MVKSGYEWVILPTLGSVGCGSKIVEGSLPVVQLKLYTTVTKHDLNLF